jgi:hypothetical protein
MTPLLTAVEYNMVPFFPLLLYPVTSVPVWQCCLIYSYVIVLVAFLRLQLCTKITHSMIQFSSPLSIFLVALNRSIQLLLLWISEQFKFYGVRLSASCPTPNLEDQGIPLRLAPTPQPVRTGWPYQQLRYHQYSSKGLRSTQTQPP